jgi:AraC-like DNA-binding protein
VLLTAKIEASAKVEGIKTGADAYIEKPFSPQVLTAQLQNLVESRKKLRKKFSEMPFAPLTCPAGSKADELFLDKVNQAIERNIDNQDFSIDMLAEEVCISRSGLFAKVKLLVDTTPNELIQLIRLKKAAQLLQTREYRINEICYLVGFNNPSYFSKCFQKLFGVLPKDFVSRGRNLHQPPQSSSAFSQKIDDFCI